MTREERADLITKLQDLGVDISHIGPTDAEVKRKARKHDLMMGGQQALESGTPKASRRNRRSRRGTPFFGEKISFEAP